MFDPATSAATWTDISYDIGDQPVNDAVLDAATGDIYISTDFGVYRLVNGTQTWIPAADGLPTVAVSGLTLADGEERRPPALRGDPRSRRVPACG